MNAQDLKNSILQRAIEGKLVPQRKEEGTAKELLAEIRAEKARLIKEKKIKKQRKLIPISMDDLPFDIPENWVWTRLEEILLSLTDGTHKTPVYKNEGIPFLSVKNISNHKIDFSNIKYISIDEHKKLCERCYPKKGDILLSKVGTTGIPVIIDTEKEFSIFVSVALLKFSSSIDAKYLLFLLESPLVQEQCRTHTRGIGNKNWVLTDIANTIVPLPPLAEQHRIVAKIEELQPDIDAYDKAQTKLQAIEQRFPDAMKKSLLQYAIEGKLVPQRKEEGTAKDLLAKIRAEKARLIKEKKIKKSKPLPAITDDEKPFDIPDSWEWVRVGDIVEIINGDRGKNYPAKSQLHQTGYIPFISAINIQNGTIEKDNLLYVDEDQYNALRSGKLSKGDIVLCIRGSLGKNGRYPFEKGAIASSLVIIRSFTSSEVFYRYFSTYLSTGLFQDEINRYNNGTAQPNLGARDLMKFLFPMPPLAEQHRIVAKLEELLPLCQQLASHP